MSALEEWNTLEWWCDECGDNHDHGVGKDSGGRPRWMDVGDAMRDELQDEARKWEWVARDLARQIRAGSDMPYYSIDEAIEWSIAEYMVLDQP